MDLITIFEILGFFIFVIIAGASLYASIMRKLDHEIERIEDNYVHNNQIQGVIKSIDSLVDELHKTNARFDSFITHMVNKQ